MRVMPFSVRLFQRKYSELQTGLTLGAFQRTGVVVTENEGPWRYATFLIQETVVTDAGGGLVLEAAVCETTDPDGDLTWCTLWLKAGSPAKLRLIAGTGKWDGISGQGEMAGFVANRADDYVMPKWSINWQVDREKGHLPDAPIDEGAYTHHDRGFSIHGPHIVESTRTLTNGIRLEVNTQTGILHEREPRSQQPAEFRDRLRPRHHRHERRRTHCGRHAARGHRPGRRYRLAVPHLVVRHGSRPVPVHRWNRQVGGHQPAKARPWVFCATARTITGCSDPRCTGTSTGRNKK